MNPRPKLLTLLAIVQWLLVLFFLFIFAIHALVLSSTQPPAEGVMGFWIRLTSSFAFALVSTLAGFGLWKAKLWGQWAAVLAINLSLAALAFVWFVYDDWDHPIPPIVIGFASLLVLHLLPATWRAFRSPKLESPAPTI